MNEKIDETIAKLLDQTKAWKADSHKALQGSQAVLNLAHAKQLLSVNTKSKGAGS